MSKENWAHSTIDCPDCGRTVTENNLSQHIGGRKCRIAQGLPPLPTDKKSEVNKHYYRKLGASGQKVDVNGDPIEFRLTRDQYDLLLEQAGITTDDIGGSLGKYNLCRNDDIGHYEMGNCAFRLFEENNIEGAHSDGKFAGHPVIVDGVWYRSIHQCIAQSGVGVSHSTVCRRLRSEDYPNYQYAETS